jgi:hypothetical protein
MRLDWFVRTALGLVAVSLAWIAFGPLAHPPRVHAQTASTAYYIEPGTVLLRKPDGTRQVAGKVFIDLNTGNVWGFPTGGDVPYPFDNTQSTPPVSQPMLLGRYDLGAMRK